MYWCFQKVQPLLGVKKYDKKSEPAIYKLYDFTKGGADIVNQILLIKSKDPKVDNGNFVLPAGYLWSQIQHCLLLEPEGPKEGKLLW